MTLSVPFWENSSFRGKLWRHFVGIRVMAIQPFVFWGGVHQKGLISRASYSSLGSKASDVFGFTNLLLVTLVERGSSLPVMRSELYTAKTDWWGWWAPESIWFVPLCTLSLAGNLNFLVRRMYLCFPHWPCWCHEYSEAGQINGCLHSDRGRSVVSLVTLLRDNHLWFVLSKGIGQREEWEMGRRKAWSYTRSQNDRCYSVCTVFTSSKATSRNSSEAVGQCLSSHGGFRRFHFGHQGTDTAHDYSQDAEASMEVFLSPWVSTGEVGSWAS